MIDSSPIVVNEDALCEWFIPDHILHREGQIKEIAKCLSPALENKQVNNVFVVGPPGAGKTLIVKWLLKEKFPKNHVYIECWNCRSEHRILEQILLQLGHFAHNREPIDHLVFRITNELKRKVIVCLDEADQLRTPNILYTLARYGLGLILISNHSFMSWDLDNRIKSSLLLNEIEFRPYSQQELFDILKDRTAFAFRLGSVSDDILKTVSIMAKGDVRVGILMLKSAAKNAEANGMSHITIEEVKQSLKGAKRMGRSYLLKRLNDHQLVIYDILKRRIRLPSRELYDEYSKSVKNAVGERWYRSYMQGLVELSLVSQSGTGRWKTYSIAS